jgi:hypothetical protein
MRVRVAGSIDGGGRNAESEEMLCVTEALAGAVSQTSTVGESPETLIA